MARILGNEWKGDALAPCNLRRTISLISDLHSLRAELGRQRKPVDARDAAHLALLKQLWAAFYPSSPFSVRSEEWMRLGFQGSDPTTDFRGMGCLALREIVHFSEVFREEALALAAGWAIEDNLESGALPFAITAINASSWLWGLFMEGRLDRCFLVRGASLQTYRNLFCEMLCGFLRTWKSEAPGSIGEFQRVSSFYLTETRRRLEGNADHITNLYM